MVAERDFDVVALRTFVPARDFETSLRFYAELGFDAERLGDDLARMNVGAFGFFLQRFYVPELAGNLMLQLNVRDLDAWWERIAGLDLAGRYGVRAPTAPAVQPWGLRVTYVVDPSGVLWHFAEHKR